MSEPAGQNDENLRRVREKVMQLAREIEKMSGEEIPPNVFYPEFLTRVVTAVGARAGAVWLLEGGSRLSLAAEVNLDQTGLRERPGALQMNEKLLIDVLQTGEAKTLVHGAGVQLPTEHIMVLSALHKQKECVGVVQLFQRTDVPEKARSGYMQFLEQMCGYASRYIEGKRRNAAMSDDMKSQFWTDFEQFTLRIQRSLDEQEVADAAASDSRPLLGCDRVSIVTRKGRSVKVRAVSGQSTVNGRANLIVAMTKLAKRVLDSGDTLLYTGRIEGLAPQIEKPLANFVQESGSRMIMMVPMFESSELVREQGEEAEQKRKKKRPKTIGCIVVEQVAESEPAPQLEQRAELLADHVGAAMWNARTHGRIFGRSIFKIMGRILEWFHGRKLAITTLVLMAVAGIVAALTLIKVSYPVDAEGKLMPVEQHAVFPLWDGEIVEIRVQPDSAGVLRVTKDQVLMDLENDEIDAEIRTARGEVEEKKEVYRITDSARRAAEGNRDNPQEAHRLQVELVAIEGELQIAQNHLQKLLDRKEEKLRIRSPADGLIPDFKRMEVLQGRPVHQGDHLFDVMNDQGEWHMELLVEEKRMGHILKAQQDNIAAGGTGELEGEFSMVSMPDAAKLKCRLQQVASRSIIDPELGTAFELICIAEDGVEFPVRQIGSEVSVRLYCGECTLAFRLFGDVVEFVQRNLWWF
ncbi:MAG: hypothetical protein KDA81_10210 [Planctomycetaceae bacterium]|nr:hypothetical protein [Planctomycetaceae bacterium]